MDQTTIQTPFTWSEGEKWRKIFMHISDNQLKEYKKLGDARRAEQAKHRQL